MARWAVGCGRTTMWNGPTGCSGSWPRLRSRRSRNSDFSRNPRVSGARSSLQNPVRTQAFRDLQPQRLQDSFLLAHRASDAAKHQLLAVGRLQLDVANGNLAQLPQNDLGRHRARLRRGLVSVRIGLVDLRLQARTLGQMVQRLPEGIR